MKKRVVHYKSYSHFAFDCFWDELEKHNKSEYPVSQPSGFRIPIMKHKTPSPIVRADLRQVNCPKCWQSILKMAVEFADKL